MISLAESRKISVLLTKIEDVTQVDVQSKKSHSPTQFYAVRYSVKYKGETITFGLSRGSVMYQFNFHNYSGMNFDRKSIDSMVNNHKKSSEKFVDIFDNIIRAKERRKEFDLDRRARCEKTAYARNVLDGISQDLNGHKEHYGNVETANLKISENFQKETFEIKINEVTEEQLLKILEVLK